MNQKLVMIVSVITALSFGGCKSAKIIRENIEWSDFWWENEPDATKPRVLFIGNSITRGYFPLASKKLSDVANCDRYATSRSIVDPALLKETRMAMSKYHHAVIHFNNGLHGWHLNSVQYEKGLRKYVRFLMSHKSRGCKLVYSLTTPVPSKEDRIKLDPEQNQVVIDRNRIARKIMEENEIPVIDLYGLMEPELERYSSSKGNVHYNKDGNERLANRVSEEILELIGK
ncbi:MAG: SGNH/GDSL hydrolase family protein [Mangrovibacterium sp.]